MATTVTYKSNTLTTATNETKILKTAGKYMEDDVTITDISGGGGGSVSQDAQGYIVLPSTGGSDYTSVTLTVTDISPEAEWNTWIGASIVDRDNDMLLPGYNKEYSTPSVSLEIVLFKGQSHIVVDNVFVSCSGGVTHMSPGSPNYLLTGNASIVVDGSEI